MKTKNLMLKQFVSATVVLKKGFPIIALIVSFGINNVLADDNPNRFNRLFTPPGKSVQALKDDGIHDPEDPGLKILQEPKEAFAPLDKSTSGNFVDWTKSLNDKKIKPLYDLSDPSKKPQPMDLNIVMQVKGSMPDVVFPHITHTELLDCSVCHPKVFVPQKGANQISMAQIMLGQKCGICHGSVAFPVNDCKACHVPTAGKNKASKKTKKP
jgi:c(7)-type cytochrome triheme protein